MAFRPLISCPSAKALAVAGLCLLVTYPLANVVIHGASPLLGIIIFVALLVGCGAVVGYLAARSPLMHGVILGAMAGVVAILGVAVFAGLGAGDIGSMLRSGLPALISMAVPGIILCALGAVLGDYLRERRRAP
jgi:hypothetical protein